MKFCPRQFHYFTSLLQVVCGINIRKLSRNYGIIIQTAKNLHLTKLYVQLHLQPNTHQYMILYSIDVEIPVAINLAPCLHKLFRKHHLSFSAFAIVKETSDYLVCSHLAKIEYPDVEIQVSMILETRLHLPIMNIFFHIILGSW